MVSLIARVLDEENDGGYGYDFNAVFNCIIKMILTLILFWITSINFTYIQYYKLQTNAQK